MEDQAERVELTGFVTKSFGTGRGSSSAQMQREQRKKHGMGQAKAYLLVRLGVCALLLCGVVALKLAGGFGAPALGVISTALGDEREADPKNLGKLRFVQIPSIIDVFAPKNRPVLPAEPKGFTLLDDGTVLKLDVEPGSVVRAPFEGSVRSVTPDTKGDKTVCIAAPDGTEYLVSGLCDIAVEPGEPLSRESILGYAAGGEIRVSVSKNGRPLEITSLFDVGSLG